MKQKLFSLLTLLLVGISSAWADEFSAAEIATNPTGGTKKNHVTCSSSYTSTTNKKVKNVSNVPTVSISNSADDSHSSYYIQIQADAGYTLNSPVTLRVASNNSSSVSFVAILWKGDFDDDKADAYQALTAPANSSTTDETATITFDASTYRTIRIYRRVNYVIGDNKKAQLPSSGSNTINIASVTATAAAACTDVAAPTSLSCTAHTKNSLTFGWTAAANASSYDVTLYDDSECTNEVATDNVTEVTKTFTGLNASKTYYCKVQSKGDGSTYCTEGNVTDAANGTTDNKDFTVTAASNNDVWGTAAAAAGSLDASETTEVTATPNSGYKFVSWAVSGEGASLSSNTDNPTTLTIGSADATVTATFRELYHYTITYNKGAYGTGDAIANGDKTEDADFTLTTSKYTRDGYVQTGWALTDGGSKAYDMGGTYTANEDLGLYPVWVELDAQTNISGATTWDWSTVTNGSNVDLTGTEILNTDVLLSNISKYGAAAITTSGEFDQTGLIINGQYAYRLEGENRFFQGTFLKFNTTIPGNVTVTYANTGNNDPRTVNVNGNKGSKSSNKNTTYQTETFAVSTGAVIIKGVQVSDDVDKMLRIKSVVFTPLPEPSDPVAEGATVTLNTTANMDGWRSYNNNTSKKYTVSANTKVYYASATGDSKVTLEEIAGGVPANTAVILHKTDAAGAAAEIVLTETDDDIAAPASNELKVSTLGQNLGKVYRLGYKTSDGVGFYTYTTTSAPAGIIYVASVSGANFLSLDFGEGDVTAISEIEKMRKGDNETFFDLQGRKVAQPTKGLYIVNGRKVIIK